jgi:hypothetical protein
VWGQSAGNGFGVRGDTHGGLGGVVGGNWSPTDGNGVYGESHAGFGYAGVYGESVGSDGAGVYGEAEGGLNAVGVRGRSQVGWAGYFDGLVHITGNLSESAGSSMIDDPIDPANKYLYHSSVESPDMMNIYYGNVSTDAKGEAVVTLPDWFEALNKDFRYQLTIMGDQFAQARVSSKIKNNRFTIMTDKPNIEVSWQVTGVRHDPYAEKNRIPVEQDKAAGDKGKYLYPQGYGQPESKEINHWPQNAKPQEPKP